MSDPSSSAAAGTSASAGDVQDVANPVVVNGGADDAVEAAIAAGEAEAAAVVEAERDAQIAIAARATAPENATRADVAMVENLVRKAVTQVVAEQLAPVVKNVENCQAQLAVAGDRMSSSHRPPSNQGYAHDKSAAARGLELETYHHLAVHIWGLLRWEMAKLGGNPPTPQMQEAFKSVESLIRLLLLHLGALELVPGKGWIVYNAYTSALRPYAADPPAKWEGVCPHLGVSLSSLS
jgi:hypothetical protein